MIPHDCSRRVTNIQSVFHQAVQLDSRSHEASTMFADEFMFAATRTEEQNCTNNITLPSCLGIFWDAHLYV